MRRIQKTIASMLSVLSVVTMSWLVQPPIEASEALQVVAIGDSYTSGTGALDYAAGDCYRSPNAYVHRYANELQKLGIATHARNLACHGAKLPELNNQIDNDQSAIGNADVILLTIGGNDAGFKEIATWCLAVTRLDPACGFYLDDAESRMPGIAEGVKRVLSRLNQLAPQAQIVLLGYPYLVDDCRENVANVRLLQAKSNAKYRDIVSELNQIPLSTAGRVTYAEMLGHFQGHEVCGDKQQYIRGSLDTSPTNLHEWWHPNKEGHLHFAKKLTELGVHKRVSVSTPTTTTTQPAPSTDYVYKNLPFKCGVRVPTATTYDSYNYNGTVFYHGKSIDLPMPSGTPVTSPASGVAYVRWDEYGYGRYIDVVRSDGVFFRMAHLQSSVSISNGATVQKGQVIGRVGTTGASTGPHLHLERRNSGGQLSINLDGPSLVWSQPSGTSGDRYTLHALESGNCGGSTTSVLHATPLIHLQGGGVMRAVHPNGNTQTLLSGIMTPNYRVSCDRDNNGQDETYSAEYRGGNWYIMQMKVTNGVGMWSEWRKDFMGKTIKGLSCGDRNGDGRDELKAHLAGGGEIWMLSATGEIKLIPGISPPVFRVECDVDRDGREEMISLERAGTNEWRLMVANFDSSGAFKSWSRLMPDRELSGHKLAGMSCGDRDGNGRDELKLFSANDHKLYRVTEHSNPSDRYLAGLWGGLTTPSAMIECDINSDGIDEFFSVENRAEGLFIMKGTIKPLKSWSVFSTDFSGKSITDLSCGTFDLK